MINKIHVYIQYLLPKRWLTYLIGLLASWEGNWCTYYAILLFIKIYKINITESEQLDLHKYTTFNNFFTRKLKNTARSIDTDPSTLIIPADGFISQIGKITEKNLFQVKGHYHCLEGLLAGHNTMINYFKNGSFSIIYIPPKNCHRVYMPCTGTLREVLYIPGELFSVHPKIINNIPNIFARNERVICFFDTDFGCIAQILVGATIVGSIKTIWSGIITPPREGIIKHWHYPSANNAMQNDKSNTKKTITLIKGHEMGLFQLGSTVINLFNNKTVILNKQLKIHDIARIGMPLAQKRI